MNTCRVALMGCVTSSRVTLKSLLAMPLPLRVAGLITRRSSTFNTDYEDLAPLAIARDIPVLFVEDAATDAQQAQWLHLHKIDLLFCVGWSHLLGEQLLRAAPLGTVGFHPAALPANRGRHPLIWALALGLTETASTFFLMDSGADSGPLLDQVRLPILAQDDAASLYARMLEVMPSQIFKVANGLCHRTLIPQDQDESLASHWRKRSAADGRIDWRMSAINIHNLVRALTRPYPGAEFVHHQGTTKVWRTEVQVWTDRRCEPGKVLAVQAGQITVKCGDDALKLLDHELTELPIPGDYL